MADRRKNRRRNEKSEDGNKCTKEEYAVAKHLRFNVPVKNSKFVAMGEEVKAFFAKDAVDALLESKWAKDTSGDIQITDRKSCVNLMNIFLQKGLFHRAVKVERKKDKSDKAKKKKKDDDAIEEEKKSKKDKKVKAIVDGQENETKAEEKKKDKKDEDKKDDKKEEKKKKERKLKLNMHDDQLFIDGDNIYVWIYDPIPAKTFIIGLLMVVGVVAFCLFPLWPDEMRIGVYYLSLVGASFVGFVLFLVILKQILFCCMWVLTFGKIHFWIFPNLTEDVGVIESFKPFYMYEIKKPGDAKQKAKDVKKEIRKRREKALENEETESETQEGDGEKTEEQGFEMVSHDDITENKDQVDDVKDEENEEDQNHEGDDEDIGDEEDIVDEEEGRDTETGDNSDNNVDKKKDK